MYFLLLILSTSNLRKIETVSLFHFFELAFNETFVLNSCSHYVVEKIANTAFCNRLFDLDWLSFIVSLKIPPMLFFLTNAKWNLDQKFWLSCSCVLRVFYDTRFYLLIIITVLIAIILISASKSHQNGGDYNKITTLYTDKHHQTVSRDKIMGIYHCSRSNMVWLIAEYCLRQRSRKKIER